ncbi:MAG: DUF397 domain-containing protein [Gemmatimonadales bacterium]
MLPNVSGMRWRKSTHSGGEGGQCVELGVGSELLAVRDSKNVGPALAVDWRPLIAVLASDVMKR